MERLPQSLSVGADIIRPGCPVRNGGRMISAPTPDHLTSPRAAFGRPEHGSLFGKGEAGRYNPRRPVGDL